MSARLAEDPAVADAAAVKCAAEAACAAALAAERAAWAEQAERSNMFALRLMRWIAMALGRRVARWALHPICLYFLCFGGVPARESAHYLGHVLGRRPHWRERYRHIHHFAATVLDRVYFLQERIDEFAFDSHGTEHFDAVYAKGRGALLVGAHFGSFEALRAFGEFSGHLRVAMVMYEDNARQINAILRAVAPKAHLNTIALGRLDAMLTLRQWLNGGGVAGLLADRAPATGAHRAHTHRLPFLGAEASFSDGPFRLAALLRQPVLFMVGLYHGDHRYELRFMPVADFSVKSTGSTEQAIAEAIRSYASILESLCRETPYNWFNFFDFWAAPAAATVQPAGAKTDQADRPDPSDPRIAA